MTDLQVFLLFLGMAAVTYIPRAVPMVFTGKLKFGAKTEKFLKLIPFTAMSALVFPGVFGVDENNPLVGLAGVFAAAVLAWLKCPVIICVIAAVITDLLLFNIL